MRPLFTFGDLVLDVVARADSPLACDTDTPGQVRSAPGGSAANFAVWSRRLGDAVTFACRVGDDLLGRALVGDLTAEGVDVAAAFDPAHPTAVLVLFSEGSQRHMMVPSGANHFLDATDIPAAAVAGAGWLHLTGYSYFWEGPSRAAARALHLARQGGLPVSLDPSSAGFIRRHGLTLPDGLAVLLPNREEAAVLTGFERPADAARKLGEWAPLVAVKLGPEGALLWHRGELTAIGPAPLTGPEVDGTGAGDAWGAAFIHGLRHGLDPVDAARRAGRIGARIVTRMGARPQIDLT